MSENGPYNQPPQNPYGGGDNSGGQQPFGQPYGDPNAQGQPHGVPYGDHGTGGQPGYGGPAGFPSSPEQQMYAGGQPPYPGGPMGPGGPGAPMGPGGPGYPPPPQQPSAGSKAGLWVVIGGGVVIVVLVIAVIVMLIGNGQDPSTVASEPDTSQSTEENAEEDEQADDAEPQPGTDAAPAGEPPYSVPAEPCDAFTDQVISDFLVQDGGNKSVQDQSSYCDSLRTNPPEGNPEGSFGALEIVYRTPYSAADSIEAAKTKFQDDLQQVTGEGPYSIDSYKSDNVEESKEVDLGDEAHYVLTKYDFLGDEIPQAVMLIRTANINIRIEYQLHPSFGGGDTAEDLVMPDNVEEIMLNVGADAVAVVGT